MSMDFNLPFKKFDMTRLYKFHRTLHFKTRLLKINLLVVLVRQIRSQKSMYQFNLRRDCKVASET